MKGTVFNNEANYIYVNQYILDKLRCLLSVIKIIFLLGIRF